MRMFIMAIVYYYLFELQWMLPGGSGTTIRHNIQLHISHEITHHAQTKHSTQSYTNNEGHITHNEYNTHKKSKAIPVTGRGGL
jgi:hypothetical protein